MRSLLIGLIGAFVAGTALAQPTPAPAPRPKAAVPAQPSIPQAAPKAPAETAQSNSGSSFFPFKLPGFGADSNAQFDPKQRALIDKVNMYLMSVQLLSGDFVQVGPDGRRA